MKVVIDTNVLVNGDLGPFSLGRKILTWVTDGQLTAVVSPSIKSEYRLKVDELITDSKFKSFLTSFISTSQVVFPRHRSQAVVADQDDSKFVDCALAANAEYIITDDRHLLDLEDYQGVRMVTPKRFVQIFEDQSDATGSSAWTSWFGGILKP